MSPTDIHTVENSVTPRHSRAKLKRAVETTELRVLLLISKEKSPEKESKFPEAAQHPDARNRPGTQVSRCPVLVVS